MMINLTDCNNRLRAQEKQKPHRNYGSNSRGSEGMLFNVSDNV
jgi:hypothetical protein